MVSYERKVGGFSTKKAKQKTLMFRVFTIKEFMSPPQWRLRAQITCVHIDSTLSLPVLVFYKIGSSDIWIIQHKKNLYKEKKNVCVCCVCVYLWYTCIGCICMYVGTYVRQCMCTHVYVCGSLRLMLRAFLYHSLHFYWGLVSCWTQSSRGPTRLASQLALGSPISASQALGFQASSMPTWNFMPFPGSLHTELSPQA